MYFVLHLYVFLQRHEFTYMHLSPQTYSAGITLAILYLYSYLSLQIFCSGALLFISIYCDKLIPYFIVKSLHGRVSLESLQMCLIRHKCLSIRFIPRFRAVVIKYMTVNSMISHQSYGVRSEFLSHTP